MLRKILYLIWLNLEVKGTLVSNSFCLVSILRHCTWKRHIYRCGLNDYWLFLVYIRRTITTFTNLQLVWNWKE